MTGYESGGFHCFQSRNSASTRGLLVAGFFFFGLAVQGLIKLSIYRIFSIKVTTGLQYTSTGNDFYLRSGVYVNPTCRTESDSHVNHHWEPSSSYFTHSIILKGAVNKLGSCSIGINRFRLVVLVGFFRVLLGKKTFSVGLVDQLFQPASN